MPRMTYESLKRACVGYTKTSDGAQLAVMALNVEFGKAMLYDGSTDPAEMLQAARLHLITHRASIQADVDAILHHLDEIEKRANARPEMLETWELEAYEAAEAEDIADEPASTRASRARGWDKERRRRFGV
jgi:hypothetical protein